MSDIKSTIYTTNTDSVLIGKLFLSSGVNVAELWWDGEHKQLFIRSMIESLNVEFDGTINASEVVSSIQAPMAHGNLIWLAQNKDIYFCSQYTQPLPSHAIVANGDRLMLDNVSLYVPSFTSGVKFDLRCDFSGYSAGSSGAGLVVVLADIVTIG